MKLFAISPAIVVAIAVAASMAARHHSSGGSVGAPIDPSVGIPVLIGMVVLFAVGVTMILWTGRQ